VRTRDTSYWAEKILRESLSPYDACRYCQQQAQKRKAAGLMDFVEFWNRVEARITKLANEVAN